MEVPYELEKLSVSAPGGAGTCMAIKFPSRVFITKLVVVQVAGAADVYTVDVYNREAACSASPANAELYRVLPKQTSVAGLVSFLDTRGYGFFNRDQPVGATRDNTRMIYVKITPGGAGAKTFDIAIGCRALHS